MYWFFYIYILIWWHLFCPSAGVSSLIWEAADIWVPEGKTKQSQAPWRSRVAPQYPTGWWEDRKGHSWCHHSSLCFPESPVNASHGFSFYCCFVRYNSQGLLFSQCKRSVGLQSEWWVVGAWTTSRGRLWTEVFELWHSWGKTGNHPQFCFLFFFLFLFGVQDI